MPEITGWRWGPPGAGSGPEHIDRRGQRLGEGFPMDETRQSTGAGHLWAIGYDGMDRAVQVKDEIIGLGWDEPYLILSDVAVVVRHPDGSFTLDREPLSAPTNILGCTAVGFIAGLVLAAPLAGAAVGALLGGAGTALAATVGIGDDFVREVEEMMKPGTSALFVLDDEGDMDVILHRIRGLGGTVLKTNVDVERAKLIQTTLTEAPRPQRPQGGVMKRIALLSSARNRRGARGDAGNDAPIQETYEHLRLLPWDRREGRWAGGGDPRSQAHRSHDARKEPRRRVPHAQGRGVDRGSHDDQGTRHGFDASVGKARRAAGK